MVTEYFARALAIVSKLKSLGEPVQETTVVEKVFRSMTEKFNYVVCSIVEANDVSKMTIDGLQSSLLIHEQLMTKPKEDEHALKITGGGRSRGRGRRFRGGRGRGRQQVNKELIECYNCRKLGHYQYECPSFEEKANYAEDGDGELMLLMAYIEGDGEIQNNERCAVKEESDDHEDCTEVEAVLMMATTDGKASKNPKVWYLDSGCSNHEWK